MNTAKEATDVGRIVMSIGVLAFLLLSGVALVVWALGSHCECEEPARSYRSR